MIDKDEVSMAIYIGYLYGGVAGIYVLIMYRTDCRNQYVGPFGPILATYKGSTRG